MAATVNVRTQEAIEVREFEQEVTSVMAAREVKRNHACYKDP